MQLDCQRIVVIKECVNKHLKKPFVVENRVAFWMCSVYSGDFNLF